MYYRITEEITKSTRQTLHWGFMLCSDLCTLLRGKRRREGATPGNGTLTYLGGNKRQKQDPGKNVKRNMVR